MKTSKKSLNVGGTSHRKGNCTYYFNGMHRPKVNIRVEETSGQRNAIGQTIKVVATCRCGTKGTGYLDSESFTWED